MSDTIEKKGPWSTEDQIALLVSIIENLGGAPNFKNMALPIGRSTRNCREQFLKIRKDMSSVPMTAALALPVTKKRAKTTKNVATEGEIDGTGAESISPTERYKRKAPMDEEDPEAIAPAKSSKKIKIKIEDVEDEQFGGKRADWAV